MCFSELRSDIDESFWESTRTFLGTQKMLKVCSFPFFLFLLPFKGKSCQWVLRESEICLQSLS